MSKTRTSIILNSVLLIIFLLLDSLALKRGLEETFVFLTLAYGLIVIIINAFYFSKLNEK